MNTRKLAVKITEKKGAQLICARNYENASGEISNQLLVINTTFKKASLHDLALMENVSVDVYKALEAKHADNLSVFEKGWDELITSLRKTNATDEEKEILRANNDATINRSDAQKDAYIIINEAMKYQRKDDGSITLYVYGFRVRKTVLQAGEYKETKSQLKTIIKRDIEKTLGFKSTQFANLKIENAQEFALRGVVI